MRTGLQKLDGVKNVEVSLEKGLAQVELKPENKITLSQIQTVVKKNGFAPKNAQLKLKGRIENSQIIISASNESVSAILNGNTAADPKKEYLIQGNLIIKEKEAPAITVSSLQ